MRISIVVRRKNKHNKNKMFNLRKVHLKLRKQEEKEKDQ